MQTYRPTTMAPTGMVTAPHYLATQAGMRVLQAGGNAAEAAVAAAAVIAVVYPHMNSIGGDNFWLIYDAGAKVLRGLNGSGRAGRLATVEHYRKAGCTEAIPPRGYLAANTVPGVVDAWEQVWQYSQAEMAGRLPWAELLADARAYAAQGFPVTPSQARFTALCMDTADTWFRNLGALAGFRRTFLHPDGRPYQAGERMRLPDLARTLDAIAAGGAAAFYQGDIAERICLDLAEGGGLLTPEDFAAHTSTWVEPLRVAYRGLTACNLPPNCQGMASLSILNILNHLDVAALGEGTAGYYHTLVEATKLAFADRDRWLTDPAFAKIPVGALLSPEHGRELAGRIDPRRAAGVGATGPEKGDTIWIGVVDAAGNAVSLIQSIYHEFGSGIVAGDTGVLLQNRGCAFSLDPAHVNRLEPGKRTFHTLNPAMLLRNGRPYLVYGTMGGEGQPQTQAALVTRIVDFGFSPQAAVEAPRWLQGRTWGAPAADLKLEGRIPPAVAAELRHRGHEVRVVEDWTDLMGHAGAILIEPATDMRLGAADPRGDGMAAGH
jgi:oxamate amidohydrolase